VKRRRSNKRKNEGRVEKKRKKNAEEMVKKSVTITETVRMVW